VVFARSLALLSAGSNIAARMAMMAITTSSSISVNRPADRTGLGRKQNAIAQNEVPQWFLTVSLIHQHDLSPERMECIGKFLAGWRVRQPTHEPARHRINFNISEESASRFLFSTFFHD